MKNRNHFLDGGGTGGDTSAALSDLKPRKNFFRSAKLSESGGLTKGLAGP